MPVRQLLADFVSLPALMRDVKKVSRHSTLNAHRQRAFRSIVHTTLDGKTVGETIVSEFGRRVQAKMDVVLEEICASLPNGGDHETRKFIAERLLEAAGAGETDIGDLKAVALRALRALRKGSPKSAEG